MRAFTIDIGRIEDIITDTIHEYGQKIYDEAMTNLKASSVRSTFNLIKNDLGVYLYSDEAIAAYIEFGTGAYAAAYLNGRPQEMVDEAMKFYVNGKGTMEAQPYLFPVYYKYKQEMLTAINNRLQKYFDSL